MSAATARASLRSSSALRPEKAKRLVGYVPDDHTVYDKLTGREYADYIGSLYGAKKERKKEIVERYAEIFSLTNALDKQIGGYSHGMKQKICIIGSLVHDPPLWILDEPMVGLDPETMNVICANGQHKINKAVQFNET